MKNNLTCAYDHSFKNGDVVITFNHKIAGAKTPNILHTILLRMFGVTDLKNNKQEIINMEF